MSEKIMDPRRQGALPVCARNNLLQGNLDEIHGDVLHGWLFCALSAARPALFVDDVPATLIGERIPRPDVRTAIAIAEDEVGFAFRLPRVRETAVFSLYGVTPEGVFLVERKKMGIPVWENNFLSQARQAADIAGQKGAVGIVCWDGAHNPIGRAKVLYEVTSRRRPAALFCYLHREFGGSLWQPLLNTNMSIVAIPWERRRWCHQILHRYGMVFDTIWICKPRLPSFMLAAALAHDQTRLILDIDDDEDAFIASSAGCAAYSAPGQGLARTLAADIQSRTIVSPTLQARFGGVIVRHAREKSLCRSARATGDIHRLAFIGTVRPHKNVHALAKALKVIKFSHSLPLELHVYGVVQPPEQRLELEANGVVLRDFLPMRDLPKRLAEMDAVVTGFPPRAGDEAAKNISMCQVPAKISDALAAGLPVLTPDIPAIADLRGICGVYPFTTDNFCERLTAALRHDQTISLPLEFTLDGAYTAFEESERQARPSRLLRALLPCGTQTASAAPALVLIWKQHDAGIYGRRVDQLARSYKRRFPDHTVCLLELYPESTNLRTRDGTDDFADEEALKQDFLERKRHGLEMDGILLKTFWYAEARELREAFFAFFVQRGLYPENTLIVLFPIIQDMALITDLLRPYRSVVDVVDNQLSWAEDDTRRNFLLEQYFTILAPARHVVFNTDIVRDFFAHEHFLDAVPDVRTIPNWYSPPDDAVFTGRAAPGRVRRVFYSGNMNDRMDWELLGFLAGHSEVCLHMAGTARRATNELDALLKRGNVIYHGVTTERETLALLQCMDAAIVPHRLDHVSIFMNPIKAQMFMSAGVPVLCPEFLDIEGNALRYRNAGDCLRKLLSLETKSMRRKAGRKKPQALESEEAYLRLLVSVRDGCA